MYLVVIILGFVVGGSMGASNSGLFGAFAGAVIAGLMYRLANARADIMKLQRQVDAVEGRQHAIPVSEEAAATPAPEPQRAEKKISDSERLSIYEIEDLVSAPEEPEPSPQPEPEPEVVVRERTPVEPREPSTIEHLADVAKRWITTGNVPVKVGIIISFIGVSFLLKYAIDNSIINISISARYIFVALFAGVLMGLGWRMRESNRVYALSLQGGGIGILFLVVFAAFRLHELLSPVSAFSILVLLTAATGYLAVKQESRALAILGTTGGFLAPLLVSTGSGNHVALFSYYLVLNCAVLGVAWVRAWRELNIIGFVFTFGVGTMWGLQYYEYEKFASAEPFLALFFIFYTVIAILFAFKSRPKLRGYVDGTLVFGTPTIAFALQSEMLKDTEYGLAITAAVVAAFYAALAFWLWNRKDERFDLLRQSFTALSVAFGTIAVPLALDDRWTAIAWALEGTALVWIGVRQSTSLAKAAGILLSFAGGIAFLNYGWINNLGIPVLNGNFIGAALIAVAAIYSAWLLREDKREREWQRLASGVLLLWGLLWWFGAGFREIFDRVPGRNELHSLMLFGSLSFAAIAYGGQRFDWRLCKVATLTALPLGAFAALFYLFEYDHFLAGLGILCWAVTIAAHFYILKIYGSGRIATLWHICGALLLAAMTGYEVFWQIDEVAINQVWPFTFSMIALGSIATLLIKQHGRSRWPFSEHYAAYHIASLLLTGATFFFVIVACINDPGSPSPLPFIPVLNPLDVLSIGVLALGWFVMQNDHLSTGINDDDRRIVLLWGGTAFLLSTLALMRAVHHIAGVPWDDGAMMDSTVLQASLTIFWAVLGVAGMLLGNKRHNRNVWFIGVGLMTIVVLKLMVVDLSNTGTVARIVSFLGVGVLLLVVGYFSPVPPRQED